MSNHFFLVLYLAIIGSIVAFSLPYGIAQESEENSVTTLLINGEHFPIDQFFIAPPDNCSYHHYHSYESSVTSLEGSILFDPDPNGCGFGIQMEVPVVEITLEEPTPEEPQPDAVVINVENPYENFETVPTERGEAPVVDSPCPKFKGTGTPGYKVQIMIADGNAVAWDLVAVGHTEVDENGNWEITLDPPCEIADGYYKIDIAFVSPYPELIITSLPVLPIIIDTGSGISETFVEPPPEEETGDDPKDVVPPCDEHTHWSDIEATDVIEMGDTITTNSEYGIEIMKAVDILRSAHRDSSDPCDGKYEALAQNIIDYLEDGNIEVDELDDANAETSKLGTITLDSDIFFPDGANMDTTGGFSYIFRLAWTLVHEKYHAEEQSFLYKWGSDMRYSGPMSLIYGDNPQEIDAWGYTFEVMDDVILDYSLICSQIPDENKQEKFNCLNRLNTMLSVKISKIEYWDSKLVADYGGDPIPSTLTSTLKSLQAQIQGKLDQLEEELNQETDDSQTSYNSSDHQELSDAENEMFAHLDEQKQEVSVDKPTTENIPAQVNAEIVSFVTEYSLEYPIKIQLDVYLQDVPNLGDGIYNFDLQYEGTQINEPVFDFDVAISNDVINEIFLADNPEEKAQQFLDQEQIQITNNQDDSSKGKQKQYGFIVGDLIWPYHSDGTRMTDKEATKYWRDSGYSKLAIDNAIAVREADVINGVQPPQQIDPVLVTTPPLPEKGSGKDKEKESKERGPKGPQQQGIMTPSGDYLPPIKQIKAGIAPQEVLCNEGKQLIFKLTNGKPSCVSEVAAEKLVARGWATQ